MNRHKPNHVFQGTRKLLRAPENFVRGKKEEQYGQIESKERLQAGQAADGDI